MIGIFTSNENDWNVRQLKEEMEKREIQCACFPITDFVARVSEEPRVTCGGYDLKNFDALLVRWVPRGSAEQTIFRMDVLHRLENLGIRIINPALSIERSADKYYTCSLLEDIGIPTPRTIATENYGDAMNAFLELKDVVIKPLFGSLGVGILRVDDKDLAYRVFRALEFGRNVCYVQEYIPHNKQDIRAFVLGDEVIASMKRLGSTWKTNFSRGARVQAHKLSDELEEMSLRAAEALGCKYAGVDILESESGEHYVVEVNTIPGWKGLQSTTKTNIAEKIIDYVLSTRGE
ncbi:MAG: RimK family alpha-L-glutamate ligase [Methanocellales archaeon]|nr:RimK family alpha-L-glutamate ligase [Methanocellales archaeon]